MGLRMPILSERKRRLQQLPFEPSSRLSRDLPRDTVLRYLTIRLSGSIKTTYASGTPVSDAQSTMDNLIANIQIVISGSRTVKSVRPHLMHVQQFLSTKIPGERKSSAGASAAPGNNPTSDGGFTYGTTGQTTTVAESIVIAFEHPYAKVNREATWLNLKGVASAEIIFNTRGYSSLLGFGNSAPVVYSDSTLVIDMETVEAQFVDPRKAFSDFKQTTKELTFSAETTDYAIDINRGNALAGIMLFARDGAAGSATTATGKLASDLLVTEYALKLNGQSEVKAGRFLDNQAELRARFGVYAPNASGVNRLNGIGYIYLLQTDDLQTALPVMPPEIDNVQLFVSTAPASVVSYTNPASLTVMTDEIVTPR